VNLGNLGFLTSAGESELVDAVESVLDGQYVIDARFTLKATVEREEGGGAAYHALNDLVISKSGMARVTRLELEVGAGAGSSTPDRVGSFSADGVIFATPTGSTAYSMSAGGPIVAPDLDCIVATPVCPHTLAVRPLVMPPQERVRVRPLDEPADLVLTVDGQEATTVTAGDAVVVERGEYRVRLVRFPGQTFFQTMRRKLNWAVRHDVASDH
jgi:NAD+ kinase